MSYYYSTGHVEHALRLPTVTVTDVWTVPNLFDGGGHGGFGFGGASQQPHEPLCAREVAITGLTVVLPGPQRPGEEVGGLGVVLPRVVALQRPSGEVVEVVEEGGVASFAPDGARSSRLLGEPTNEER